MGEEAIIRDGGGLLGILYPSLQPLVDDTKDSLGVGGCADSRSQNRENREGDGVVELNGFEVKGNMKRDGRWGWGGDGGVGMGVPVAEAREVGEDEDAVQNESDGQRVADA